MLALVATSCENAPVEGGVIPETPEAVEPADFVLYATLPANRTTLNSDFSVEWNESDQIAVFNAPTGTAGYSANLHFKISDVTTGAFAPMEGVEVPYEDGVNYDWFVVSPWRATNGRVEMVTPAGQSQEDGYFPIGAQTQTGYNNSVHIASSDIMVGKALNTRTPSIALKHLAVLHKFTVTNSSNKPTTITKLTFNGGDNKIFGTFRINLTADEPAIDINNANATFNERALTVKDGTELAVGESADFYVMTAPFVLNTGETFKITIETSTGKQTVEKTATSDITFAAGTYNTADLVYDVQIAEAEPIDHLYSDTFESEFNGKSSVNSSNTTMTVTRWDSYDKSSVLVYDGNVSGIKYSYEGSVTVNCQSASVIVGMEGFFVWFKQGAKLTVSGIKLHNYTALNLSFNQTYKSSGITSEYSVDGGTTWNQIGVSAHPAGNVMETYSYNFNVPAGSETISLRFTASTSTPRMDNVKLSWQ